jgi:hypothetical protein
MFTTLKKFLTSWIFGKKKVDAQTSSGSANFVEAVNEYQLEHTQAQEVSKLVPYDESLLDRSRTQWQFGDWESLCALTRNELQHHPDRAKLALLTAAGYQQIGDMTETKAWVRLAGEWGCNQKLINQILIAGAQNTLARAAALAGQDKKALELFEAAIDTGSPNSDRLIKRARAAHQFEQLGLSVPHRLGASD